MATKEFKLPDIGEGIAEGEIVSWKVKPGQVVKEEDEFVEVMTDKATVMITAPFDAKVVELKAAEGDVVPVESVIAVFDTDATGGDEAPEKEEGSAAAEKDAAPAKGEKDVEIPAAEKGAEKGADKESADKEKESAEPADKPAPAAAGAPSNGSGEFVQASPGKVLAAPATRRRAREMGVDLQQLAGSGPRGRITNDDLQSFLGGGGAKAPAAGGGAPRFTPVSVPPAPAGREEERIPFRGLRRKIAEAMTRSKYTATHFTYVDDIDVTDLVKLRKEAKAMYAEEGVNITFLPFIMKAIVKAMKAFPMLNSSLDETTNELVVKKYFNFGIATDTDNGLVVPVLKDVDRKSIVELAKGIQELAAKTREGSIGIENLTGGTFSITNAGNIGGLFATPIINFPETAICGVHAIKDTPIVKDGQIVVGKVMYLSISIDHRIVDGAAGARWMNVVKDALEHPQKLLLG